MNPENAPLPSDPPAPQVDAAGFLSDPPGEAVATEPPQVRRGPGRPRKDGSTPAGAPKAEKPGAPKASPQKPQKRGAKMTQEQVTNLGRQITGLHAMAAMVLRNHPAAGYVKISDQEGTMLATGIAAVCEEYDLSLDGKTGAFVQMLGGFAMVYGPRVYAYQQDMAARRRQVVDVPVNQ